MSIPLLGGRDFGAEDRRAQGNRDAPAVAIVNESFVRAFFPSGSPLLRVFEIEVPANQRGRQYRIVGVVRDAKYSDLRESFTPGVFVASAQADRGSGMASSINLVVRSTLPLSSLAASLRAEATAVHPSILLRVQPLPLQLHAALVRERLTASLSAIFGLIASLLAAIGVYGVMAYSAARRTAEIGVRIALGATRESVVRLMLRDAWVALALAVPLGILVALALGRAVAGLLYGLEPTDPMTLIAATGILCAVTAVAAYLPSRRASRLEPMRALRQE
jgi:ABC-type antimicrobial peptide transport system permease subunit